MSDREKAIEYLEPISQHPTVTGDYCKHLKTALAALRAEEEREKGCRYCKGYMFNNPRTGEQFATACGVPLKHCPNCGRNLDGGGQGARKGVADER